MSGGQPSQKRDKFRKLFRSSQPPPSGSVNSTSAGASSSTSLHSKAVLPSGSGARFFAETSSQLDTIERGIIEKYAAHGVGDINIAVAQAYSAALDNKQACEDRMWRWSFRGKDVMLRDEADKVGGAESRQMAALLTGMNLAMSTASRLQVYFNQYTRLPSTLATDNFEKALIRMYVHVLRFIATAIETYEHGLATRIMRALWRTSSLEQFESECDKLGERAEIEAGNCARAMDERNWEDARRWREDLRNTLKSIDHISGINVSLSRVHVKLDLTKLITAPGATYNSHREEELAHCLPGTRAALLDQIAEWADDKNGKCIFWLCGKAGTGQSTISRTVAERLDKQLRLGASFFFKRGEGDRGNASRFFPTIAAQLADVIPGLSSYIAEALEGDSFLSSKGLRDQFEKLYHNP
nr:hypothetical protein CFP56_03325 [Quercus suber]